MLRSGTCIKNLGSKGQSKGRKVKGSHRLGDKTKGRAELNNSDKMKAELK